VRHRDAATVPTLFARVCRDGQLLGLDFAIFALHPILTASFLAMPSLLVHTLPRMRAIGGSTCRSWRCRSR